MIPFKLIQPIVETAQKSYYKNKSQDWEKIQSYTYGIIDGLFMSDKIDISTQQELLKHFNITK